jgi:hypothetical protein
MVAGTINANAEGRQESRPSLEVGGTLLAVKRGLVNLAVVHDEWWMETELEDPEACVKMLKNSKVNGLRADIFTFTQKMPGSTPKHQYKTEWESVAAANTSDFKTWWESLPQESRKNVRRSQKRGVVVRTAGFDDELIRGIAEINNESPTRQGRPNAHYGKSLDQVKADHESFVGRSDFICAYFEDEMIGYLKLVYKGEVAAILNLAVKTSHNDKRPANALVAMAIERASAKGIVFVTYGLYNYGNKRDSPLREFKSRNGFNEVLTPRYYVPLTAWGKAAMRIGLHRGILGILPTSWISFGIDARAKWYNFRHSKPV